MHDASTYRLLEAAILLPFALAAMACGESPTEPRIYPQRAQGEEYVVRGTIVQGGAPVAWARVVAWYPDMDMTTPDFTCFLGCNGRPPSDGMRELASTGSDAEGRYELTLFGCGGAHVSAFIGEGFDWVMLADTVMEYVCPMPAEIEVNLVVPEATP